MKIPDPYQVLGISPDASKNQIKKAYRRLALTCHPDRNPGDPLAEERFKQIQRAYELLTGRSAHRQIPDSAEPRQSSYPPSFYKNFDPFLSFYWEFRARYEKMRRAREETAGQEETAAGSHDESPTTP